MEFIGRIVNKHSLGFRTFSGTVKSYDASSNFFTVLYEDGDSEHLALPELLLLFEATPAPLPANLGLRPQDPLRTDPPPSGTSSSSRLDTDLSNHLLNPTATLKTALLYQTFDKEHESFKGGLIPMGNINLNVAVEEAVMEGNLKDALVSNGHPSKHQQSIGGLNLNSGLDLNQGLGGGSNQSYDSDVNGGSNSAKGGGIDLNLDATSELDEISDGSKRNECPFDLNFGIVNEPKDDDSDTKGLLGRTTSSQLVEDSTQEVFVDVEVKVMDVDIATGRSEGFQFDASRLTSPRQVTITNSTFDGTSLVSVEITDEVRLGDRTSTVLDGVRDHGYSSPQRDDLSEPADSLNEVKQTDLTNSSRRVSTRIRKRKVLEILNSPETGLRRSARRGSYLIHTPDAAGTAAVSDLAPAPTVNTIITEEEHEHTVVLPPKLELPPSSGALIFEGISVVDVFSVYSCLRSFSTLLCLSPFELEDFIIALRSENHDPLIDHIHVSLLQTLQKHLEQLSSEGSLSATNCLRSLNWDFLDLMTWPIFLVEYLLLHSSGIQPCEVSRLRVFRTDYCKQPVSMKIEILRCLCDEVIEVEVIRSELSARSLAADSDTDFDRNVNVEPTRKRRGKKEISGRASLNADVDVDDDTADKNSDECCLCKMDGSLICCDGCPAAYHSRCVGVECDLLPEGDWFCPECSIKRTKCGMRSRRSLRGAELLGIDPHGRVYFSCFDYLLVSDSYENEVLYKYYHQSDLTHVIEVLKSLELYSSILKAIYRQWDGFVGCSGVTSYADSQKFITQAEASLRGQPTISEDPKNLPYPAFADTCKSDNEKITEKESTAGACVVFNALNIGTDSANVTETIYMSSEGSIENAVSVESKRRENCLASTISDKTEFANPHLAPLEDEPKKQCGSYYINFYRFGRVAALIVEDLLNRSADKPNNTFASVEDIALYQVKSISKRLTKFYWSNDKNHSFQKERCGWCFPCRNPAEDFDCLINMYLRSICEGAETEMPVIQSKNGNSYLTSFKCGILSMEERLRGLLLGPWMNSNYTQTWRRSVMMSSDFASLKSLLLKLESSLHPRSISEEWLKYEDSTWLPGSASLVVTNSLPTSSKLSSSRKRGKCSTPESNHSASASSGPVMSWWRGGRHSRQLFSCKIMPRSVVCKAARQGAWRKMPGVLYPENSDFARRSKATAWQAAVESATGVTQLALQVRELDSCIRWDDIENINSICKWDKELRKSLRAFKKVIIRRKRMEGDVAKYLLDFGKRRIIPEVVMKHGSLVEEGSSEKKRYWLNESFVPLHLLKIFEEKRITRGSSKTSLWKDTEARSAKKKLQHKSHLDRSEADVSRNKLPKEKGFDYLFSRAAETVDSYQCGHCKKVVLAREAVSCRTCEGFFHKRHAVKSGGTTLSAECYHTCHRCRQGKPMKRMMVKGIKKGGGKQKGKVLKKSKFIPEDETGLEAAKLKTTFGNQIKRGRKIVMGAKKGKRRLKTENGEGGGGAAVVVSLRRSTRKAVKYMPVQHKIDPTPTPRRGRGRPKGSKGKRTPNKKKTSRKKDVISCHQKQRAKVFHSYWLNGLLLSRTADDERVVAFRNKSVICPSWETRVRRNRVKCNLCGEGAHTPTSNYISCETCTKWYHGDAFGLDHNKLHKVMGFRCHVCRGRSPPGLSCVQLEFHGGGSQSAAEEEEEEEEEEKEEEEEEEEETKNGSVLPPPPQSPLTLNSEEEDEVKNGSASPSTLAALSNEEGNLKRKKHDDECNILLMEEETCVRELRVYRRAKLQQQNSSGAADQVMMGGDNDDVELYYSSSSSSSSNTNDDVEAQRQQAPKKQKTTST